MLDNAKLSDIMKLINLLNNDSCNDQQIWEIGKCYFVRTVTMYIVGELKVANKNELLFKNASWVADSGRFHDAMKHGSLNEVEPFVNDVIVNRNCIVDATEWKHKLPTEQK